MDRPPFFLQWHLTEKCNLSCQHCYQENISEELPLVAYEKILNAYVHFLKDQGRKGRIQFTGGEPLLFDGLFDLIRKATRHGVPTRVLSNGTLITRELAIELKEAGCNLVQVSLEGKKDIHDSLRGAGSFEKTLKGLKSLRDAGLETTISMTLSRINAHEALDLAHLAELKADRIHFHRLVPVGQGQDLAHACLSPKELKKLMKKLLAFRKKSNIDLPLRDPLLKALGAKPNPKCACISGCAAGRDGVAVAPNGDVYPCRRLPIVVGNLYHQPLKTILRTPLMGALRDRDQLKGKCGKCPRRRVCGGCRGVAFAFFQDPLAEDPQCFLKSFAQMIPFKRRKRHDCSPSNASTGLPSPP